MSRRKHIADGSGALPALEKTCPVCNGEGRIPNRQVGGGIELGGECTPCRGGGTIPNEDGVRLLEFLRYHQR